MNSPGATIPSFGCSNVTALRRQSNDRDLSAADSKGGTASQRLPDGDPPPLCAGIDGSLQGRGEKVNGVSAGCLGLVQGNVGLLKRAVRASRLLPNMAIPMLEVSWHAWPAICTAGQLLRESYRRLPRLDLGIIGRVAKVLKQDGKLVATCSRYGVCFTETGFETEDNS